jgi:hypothetical protein
LPGSLARQRFPAALPGSLARQPCTAALPGRLARQPCPAALPGSLARQTCPADLPGRLARHTCPALQLALYTFTGRRGCLLTHLAQAGCRFECMLINAHKQCDCTPWNYPYVVSGKMEICDMFGNACFNKLISDVSYGESCGCLSDCVAASFTKFETSEDLNVEELCSDSESWVYKYIRDTKQNVEGYKYRAAIRKVLDHTYDERATLDQEMCKSMVRYC